MPKYSRQIQIPGKTAQELYQQISKDIERFLSKSPIGQCDIQRDEGAKTVTLKASLFSAALVCREGMVELDAQLSLFAAPFRSKLDEGIDKWLAKTFEMKA